MPFRCEMPRVDLKESQLKDTFFSLQRCSLGAVVSFDVKYVHGIGLIVFVRNIQFIYLFICVSVRDSVLNRCLHFALLSSIV